jgi:sugar/nucleoside kinase (ribokinase family)
MQNSELRNMYDVAVVGLSVVDIIGRVIDLHSIPPRGGLEIIESVKLTSGGNVSNVGIDLAKLGFSVRAVTRIGDDPLGRFLSNEFKEYRIDSTGVVVDREEQTSATIVCVAEDGERTFFHTRGCLRNFSTDDILGQIDLFRNVALISFGYLGLLPELEPHLGSIFSELRNNSEASILLDTGGIPRMNVELMKDFLPHVDYFIPSREEASELTGLTDPGEMVTFFRDCGARGIVGIKLGGEGCMISDGTSIRHIDPIRVNNVVDTTGAGDGFVAGFVAATLKGYAPFEAAYIGNAVAADCITALGASTAIRRFDAYI